jgi:hypothetical protein
VPRSLLRADGAQHLPTARRRALRHPRAADHGRTHACTGEC